MAKITLSGFMGSGKTTIGKILSEKLNIPFIDLDKEIEKETDLTISQIFERKRESYFRNIEKRVLIKNLRKKNDFVCALGGGTIANDATLKYVLSCSIPVLLDGNTKILFDRAKNQSPRPLLKDFNSFNALYENRKRFYKKIPIKIPVEDNPEAVTDKILNILSEKRWKSPQKILFKTGKLFDLNIRKNSSFVLDKNVYQLYKGHLPEYNTYIVKSGEKSKNISEVIKLYDFLGKNGTERDTFLYGIGGGVTGDISGFVASTYNRGIGFISVPTTLIAQTDSAIGGKNGVNSLYGKNLVGTFRMPDETFVDPLFLNTLPEKEILSGLGEIFKYSILSENGLFEMLQRKINFNLLVKIIPICIEEKLKYVKDDFEDKKGKRILLNLGHTVGHMCENAFGYGNITHGKGVAFGIIVASYIAYSKKILKEEDFEKIVALYDKLGFSIKKFEQLKRINGDNLRNILLHDKKAKNKLLDIIVPDQYNHAVVLKGISTKEIINAVKEVLSL